MFVLYLRLTAETGANLLHRLKPVQPTRTACVRLFDKGRVPEK